MPLHELLAGTTVPPAAGPHILYRRYTKSGTETWRFLRIPPLDREGRRVVFRAIEHEHEPPKRLPDVGIIAGYVDAQEARIYEEDNPGCKSKLSLSSGTSPRDREPPTRAEPVPPAPGPTTPSSPPRSSAPSAATTIGGQLRLDL